MAEPLKDEIYQLWKIQEDLLQNYRIIAITLMGLVSAGCLVLMSNLDTSWPKYSGILYKAYTTPGYRPLFVVSMSIKIFLLISLWWLGWKGTQYFKKITDNRALYVTVFQDLLVMYENGELDAVLAEHNIEESEHGPPLFMIVRAWTGPSGRHNILTGKEEEIDERLTSFINVMKKNARNPNRHDLTRNYLKGAIYRVYNVFWFFLSLYIVIFLLHAGIHKVLFEITFGLLG